MGVRALAALLICSRLWLLDDASRTSPRCIFAFCFRVRSELESLEPDGASMPQSRSAFSVSPTSVKTAATRREPFFFLPFLALMALKSRRGGRGAAAS